MKLYVLSGLLLSVFACSAVFCQERGFDEDPEYQMELHRMQLEMREREAEMDFQQQMRELELGQRRMGLEREERAREHPDHGVRHGKDNGGAHALLILFAVVHILVAIWVYTDIRKRNSGSGIWIVIALLTGLLGALVYAVVRLGDARQNQA